jgi:protein involved in polysaccharide export with SLBB domain
MLPTETLADVIRAAGGFAPSAVQRRVQIERIVPAAQRTADGGRDRVVIDVSTPDLASAAAANVQIQAGDVIRVFRVASRVRNRIAVTGNVWTPGAQGFVPGMTVSQALRLAGGAKGDTYLGQVLVSRLRSDSTRMQLRATLRDTLGAVVNDFPLQEDDEIRVFSVSDFRPPRYVAITGAVRKAGQFAYREGMTVRDLVLLAGGLEESAFLGEAEVARLPEDRRGGATARTFRVALDSSYLFERGLDGHYLGAPGLPAPSGNSPDVALVPYDNVLILRQPDWQLQRTVVLTGEVRFPGRYALKSKNDRITDAIQRAGGLTREAYAEGVTFYRTRSRIGRIGVDLPAAMRQNRHRDNLLLQDGDSINVPLYNAVVNVTGAVNSPVAVSYMPGRTIDYYIDAAGGGSRNADLKRAYVQQPSGKVESRSRHFLSVASAPKPRPGSSVTVPELDPKDRRDLLAVVGSVAQVLASLVAIVAVVRR